MKTNFTPKYINLAAACAVALGSVAFTGAAQAQGANFGPNDLRELWTDTPARQVWKNGYGECWHSAFGPPPGYNECNPAPVAQYVPPPPAPAPVVAPPPPPAPAPVIQPAPMPPRQTRG
jgi:hypothetical protein